jgi:hypothetical protein
MLCNFIITTAPFTPPLPSLLHTFNAMISANELAAGPDVDENASIIVNGFLVLW